MEVVEIFGYNRTEFKKSVAREARLSGMAPCVLYGKKQEPIHFSVPMIQFRDIVYTPNAYFVDLNIEGNHYKAVVKDVQFHPVSDMILHADFLALDDETLVTMEVPVNFVGRSVGVAKGGKLAPKIRKVKVKALPKNMPASLDVDISHLDLGKSVRVSDIKTENITIINAAQLPLATIEIPRSLKSAQAAAAAGKK